MFSATFLFTMLLINHLVQAMLYIRKNELTSHVKLVHVYKTISTIPSELKANIRILDEAFPSITLDLVFIQGDFSPVDIPSLGFDNFPRFGRILEMDFT
ncbi:AAAP amino acid permease, putative, partial [Rhizoctonia solani AG-3 Rhs1AP]